MIKAARCGKINAVNSVSESWTGIGVVAGFTAGLLITQGPHLNDITAYWRIKFLHILQEVRGICKTRNQLLHKPTVSLDVISLVASSCGYYRGQIEQCAAHEFAVHVAT